MPAITGVVVFSLITLTIVYFGLYAKSLEDNTADSLMGQPATTILRIHGSNTLGAALVPDLAKKYLELIGANSIHIVREELEVESVVQGKLKSGKLVEIELKAHGSSTGFADMKADHCDIAAASRRIKDKERLALARFGDLRSFASEHIIALDGISIIVNRSNPLSEITMAQLVDIFSGKISNWKQINGKEGKSIFMPEMKTLEHGILSKAWF